MSATTLSHSLTPPTLPRSPPPRLQWIAVATAVGILNFPSLPLAEGHKLPFWEVWCTNVNFRTPFVIAFVVRHLVLSFSHYSCVPSCVPPFHRHLVHSAQLALPYASDLATFWKWLPFLLSLLCWARSLTLTLVTLLLLDGGGACCHPPSPRGLSGPSTHHAISRPYRWTHLLESSSRLR
jgi:hypothetical protein